VKDHARYGTDQEQRSTSDAIDERQNAACGDQKDDVLDRGRVEVGVSGLFPVSQRRLGFISAC
jgi:hypothetical protein